MSNNYSNVISRTQALSAISAFLTLEGQTVSPAEVDGQVGTDSLEEHPDLGDLLTFRGLLGRIWISPRGNVVYYAGNALRARGKLPAEFAAALARRFAERQIAGFAARNYEQETPELDDTQAVFRWREEPRKEIETAIFPNSAEVVVDLLEGRVTRFSASDLCLVRTTPPRLSEEEACNIVCAEFDRAAIEEINLMQLPAKESANGITVWSAEVMTLGPEGPMVVSVTIDADTGRILPQSR